MNVTHNSHSTILDSYVRHTQRTEESDYVAKLATEAEHNTFWSMGWEGGSLVHFKNRKVRSQQETDNNTPHSGEDLCQNSRQSGANKMPASKVGYHRQSSYGKKPKIRYSVSKQWVEKIHEIIYFQMKQKHIIGSPWMHLECCFPSELGWPITSFFVFGGLLFPSSSARSSIGADRGSGLTRPLLYPSCWPSTK